jgi:hypothetical protein
MDAHRHEVFSRLTEGRPTGAPSRWLPREVDPASVGPPESVIDRWRPLVEEAGRLRVAGDGAVLYHDLLEASFGSRVEVVAAAPSLAAMIARLARERVLAGERPAPGVVAPVYVRRPDAELARERAQRGGL